MSTAQILMAGQPLAIGIIGIGFGRQVLLPAFRTDARCEVTALCASTVEKAREAAQATGVPRYFGDWRELLADPEIKAVAIAVPPIVQAAVALAAARAGKHLLCEKPLALDHDQARAILTAATENKLAHAIDFEFPEVDAWQKAKSFLSAGTLGRIRQVALTWRIETYAHRAPVDTWKTRAAAGGGTLNNFGSHTFYYLEWLFGPLNRLAARLSPTTTADARVDCWGEFASGFPATISIAADAYLGPGHKLEVYGEHGCLILENRGSDYMRGFNLSTGTRETGKLTRQETVADQTTGDGRIVPVSRIAKRFLDAIETGVPVTPGLVEGARVQQLLDAARTSHEYGSWQEVSP